MAKKPERGTIVTMGGGGFSMEPDNLALDAWILSLAKPRGGRRSRGETVRESVRGMLRRNRAIPAVAT